MRRKKGLGQRPAVARMAWIAKALRDFQPFNASTVAREFEVTTKTVQRDLTFLRDRLGYEFDYIRAERSFHLISAPQPIL